MITAELKRLHSPDVRDLMTFSPDDPTNFSFLLQIMAAPVGVNGEESFDVIVCTPRWLEAHVRGSRPLIGRHHLIVERYDYQELQEFISASCSECRGASWQEAAAKLGRLGHWEFED